MSKIRIRLRGTGGALRHESWPTTVVTVVARPLRGLVVHQDAATPGRVAITHTHSGTAIVDDLYDDEWRAAIDILGTFREWYADGVDVIRNPAAVAAIRKVQALAKRDRGREMERVTNAVLGAESVPGSGAVPGYMRDGVLPTFLFEHKHPEPRTPQHAVVVADLAALWKQAQMGGRTPVYLCIWRGLPGGQEVGFALLPEEHVDEDEYAVQAEHEVVTQRSFRVRRETAAGIEGARCIRLVTSAGVWLAVGWPTFLAKLHSEA